MNRIFAILIAIVVAAAVTGGAYFVADAMPKPTPPTGHLQGHGVCGAADNGNGTHTLMRIVTLVDWPEAGTDTDLCSANYRNTTVVPNTTAEAIINPTYPPPTYPPRPRPRLQSRLRLPN